MVSELPAAFVPVVDALQRDSERYFGDRAARVQLLEHSHREFSDLLRIRVSLPVRSVDAFVKITRPTGKTAGDREAMARRVAGAFESTVKLYEALSSCEGVRTVRPIACFPEHLAVVTEEAAGTTLLDRVTVGLRRGRPGSAIAQLETAMHRVAAWLLAYQASAPWQGRCDLDQMREYIDVRLRRLVAGARSGFSPELRIAVLEAFGKTAPTIESAELACVPVHGDFALGNLLVAGDTVTVLDFDMSARGCRYHDLSHLYLQLDLAKAKPWLRTSGLERLQSALLHGFDPVLHQDQPLFRLMFLQHVVCHLARLVEQRENAIQRVYTQRQQRRHYRWLHGFVARPEGGR